jgi:Ca2+-transporting ATPase
MDTNTSETPELESYRHSSEDVVAALISDVHSGLSATEAKIRLARCGRNELAAEKPVPAWKKLLEQFSNVLVILLIVAGLLSAVLWLFERESALPYEAMAIFAIVTLNALMGYFQQVRAENALAALRQIQRPPTGAAAPSLPRRERIPKWAASPGC